MENHDDTTLFPWRITSESKQVVLPITFLVEECGLKPGDHIKIEVRPDGLAFTPKRRRPGDL